MARTPIEAVQESFEEDILRNLDSPRLARDLHHNLGANLARVTALRAGGAELKAIVEDQQVAISTAHQRVATTVQRICRHVRKRRVGPTTLEPMLAARSG
ncbi:MAG TPA: hypothetical protein VNA24_31300 [Hyalangium sp.]|nr:hypothetical protein [Hyalangium sp.]